MGDNRGDPLPSEKQSVGGPKPRRSSQIVMSMILMLVIILVSAEPASYVIQNAGATASQQPSPEPPPASITVGKTKLDGISLSLANHTVLVQPDLDPSVGRLLAFQSRDEAKPTVAWSFENASLETTLTRAHQGVFLNATVQMVRNCLCKTDAEFAIRLPGLSTDLQSVIVSTTPPSELTPPKKSRVMIEALDYESILRLYGVAGAFVLRDGSFEVVILYPFASISYDPSDGGSIDVAFRKGLGNLSTTQFGPGDTDSIMLYIGLVNTRETLDTAFGAFAADVEEVFPSRNIGKPFILYGVDDGSWESVWQEAISEGYTVPQSALDDQFTGDKGGGHYFGLEVEDLNRLEAAGLTSSLVLAKNGNPVTDGKSFQVNPSQPKLQNFLEQEISNHSTIRDWFMADGGDVIQDFAPSHLNVLEGYIQVLLYARSTGQAIIYNAYHRPRLWMDWAADGSVIEAPTGIFNANGIRKDYIAMKDPEFDITREFMSLQRMFFPKRTVVWHDYVNLNDSSITDSIAYFLMGGANSFSFSTNPQGHARVKPGEITKVTQLLAKMESIRLLGLGSVRARDFEYNETMRSWSFYALCGGTVTWLGGLDGAVVGGAPIPVVEKSGLSTFTFSSSDKYVTLTVTQ